MFLALKEIKKEKGRFLLIISIVVLISYLVYFLLGLAYGLALDNTTAIYRLQAKKIILADGSNKNIQSSLIELETLQQELKGLDYSLINLGRSSAYINGQKDDRHTISLVIIGSESNAKIAPTILEGRAVMQDNEAVASISLKHEKDLAIGDTIKIAMNEKEFKVVGFTSEAKYNTSSVIYTDLENASAASMIFKADDTKEPIKILKRVSAAVIHTDEPITLTSNLEIISIQDFINSIPGYQAQILTFGLMIIFLVLISSIVLGVFLYIITIQKKQTFGIMKVQGISSSYISKSVLLQTLIVSVSGLFIGISLTYITQLFLPVRVPFKIDLLFIIAITLLMIFTTILGALFSVKSVAKVDPLEVLN
ncbi:ABC transporter permease [Erysipelotrichaceae bacterium OH741_COT-311]|nr:ABC transporter permease [Erysipelotrichaceae bacterium OH741_COT-311]